MSTEQKAFEAKCAKPHNLDLSPNEPVGMITGLIDTAMYKSRATEFVWRGWKAAYKHLGMRAGRAESTEILGCDLVCTGSACPEQYDVFHDGKQIGYLRLRSGHFYAEHPVCGGKQVYHANVTGDGDFTDAQEQNGHLRFAVRALLNEEGNNV